MQTDVATFTTMAKYIALPLALRDEIPVMELLDEFMSHSYTLLSSEP